MRLSKEEYLNHVSNDDGFCTSCDDFTRDSDTEPDAEDLNCPECDDDTCCGAEQAMLNDLLEIIEEDEDPDD